MVCIRRKGSARTKAAYIHGSTAFGAKLLAYPQAAVQSYPNWADEPWSLRYPVKPREWVPLRLIDEL